MLSWPSAVPAVSGAAQQLSEPFLSVLSQASHNQKQKPKRCFLLQSTRSNERSLFLSQKLTAILFTLFFSPHPSEQVITLKKKRIKKKNGV